MIALEKVVFGLKKVVFGFRVNPEANPEPNLGCVRVKEGRVWVTG